VIGGAERVKAVTNDAGRAATRRAGAPGVVLAACFLAASWTWVIGMFLPVILTDRFGPAGWAVFALFNVLGAASVGVVLARPGAAGRFAREHDTALGLFALVTIAFQAYAFGWIARRTLQGPAGTALPLGLDTGPAVTVAMCVFVGVWAVAALVPWRWSMGLGAAVLIVSAVSFVLASTGVWYGPFETPVPSMPGPGSGGVMALALASPAIAAGFLACPYLDPTINRVRREMREPAGSLAFVIGFGGPFLVMIAMTLGYAKVWHEHGSLPAVLVVHLLAQAGFTAGVQTRALWATGALRSAKASGASGSVSGSGRGSGRIGPVKLFSSTFAVLLMLPLGNAVQDFGQLRPGLTWGQLLYEGFIAAYAVIFPAYVWICAVPWTPMAGASRRRRALIFWLTAAAAVPGFAVGFLGERYWLVAASIGLIAVAPWIAPRGGPPGRATAS